MSGIIWLVAIVSFNPIKILRNYNSLLMGYLIASSLYNSLTNIDRRIDWLHCHNDIIRLELSEHFIEEAVDHNEVARFDCGLHWWALWAAERYYVLIKKEIGCYCGNYHEVWPNSFSGITKTVHHVAIFLRSNFRQK